MHCDSVTECCLRGGNMSDFNGQTNVKKLLESGCEAQCFALFTEGQNSAVDFDKFMAFYNAQIAVDPRILPAEQYSDIEKAEKRGKIARV